MHPASRPALPDGKTLGAQWTEYLTRVLGEHGVGLFFINAPAAELESYRPASNKMVKTARLP